MNFIIHFKSNCLYKQRLQKKNYLPEDAHTLEGGPTFDIPRFNG